MQRDIVCITIEMESGLPDSRAEVRLLCSHLPLHRVRIPAERLFFVSEDIPLIQKKPFPANRKRHFLPLLTTYYCIPTYEFRLTAECRRGLLERFSVRSACGSGVIFDCCLTCTGLPPPPARSCLLTVVDCWSFSGTCVLCSATVSVIAFLILHSFSLY